MSSIDRMKLEAELGMLRIENRNLRNEKEVLMAQLFDCLQALIRATRERRVGVPREGLV